MTTNSIEQTNMEQPRFNEPILDQEKDNAASEEDQHSINAWNMLHQPQLLLDPTLITLKNRLNNYGIYKHNDLIIIANIPHILNDIVSLLKIIPQKSFLYELQSYNTLHKNPFCPVCRDKGLPADKYTSHHIWADQQRTVVICPTLLNTTCNLCKQKGHSPKYCKSIIHKPLIQQPLIQQPLIQQPLIQTQLQPLPPPPKKIPILPTLSSAANYSKNKITLSSIYTQNIQLNTYIEYAKRYMSWYQYFNSDKEKQQYCLQQSIYYTQLSQTHLNIYYSNVFHNYNNNVDY